MSSYNSYLNNEDFFSFIFNHSQNELHFVWCIWTFQVFGFFLLFLLRTIKQPVPSNLNHFQRALIWSMYICLYIALGMNVTQYSMLFKLNYYCKHQQLRGSKRERESESLVAHLWAALGRWHAINWPFVGFSGWIISGPQTTHHQIVRHFVWWVLGSSEPNQSKSMNFFKKFDWYVYIKIN